MPPGRPPHWWMSWPPVLPGIVTVMQPARELP